MKQFDINSINVAKPCSELWEDMKGDHRMRKCSSCRLNVHNLSAMNASEIEALLKSPHVGTCIRLYRRADGTLITKDCPKGLRAYRKRAARFVATAFASILSLASFSYAQRAENPRTSDRSSASIVRQDTDLKVEGTVTDPSGAVVPGAQITVYPRNSREPVGDVKSDSEGNYSFKVQKAGLFRLEVRAAGFKTAIVENVRIKASTDKPVNVLLDPSESTVVVGLFWAEPSIDVRSSTVTRSIPAEQIQRIPF